MLNIQGLSKVFNQATVNEKIAINNLYLTLNQGDYVTVIGGNGSGKSTLLNCIAGVYGVERGSIKIGGQEMTKYPEHKRAKVLGRVFQDPMMGTSAQMGIEENLALAYRRGLGRGLKWGISRKERALFRELLQILDLGLEDRLTTKVGLLSGGQRQALTLLMATLRKPQLLLLDEHTAALDPKTAAKVLDLSDRLILDNGLTALMVTHNLKDAITHGNRLIMMNQGNIVLDIKGKAKEKLTVEDLLDRFSKVGGTNFTQDTALMA